VADEWLGIADVQTSAPLPPSLSPALYVPENVIYIILLDPETGLQALRTLFFLFLVFLLVQY